MELLPRLLLIAGLLMLSCNWAASLPRSQPVATTSEATHKGNPNTTPDINTTTDAMLQSIFDINPSCQPGWKLAGSRCRKIA